MNKRIHTFLLTIFVTIQCSITLSMEGWRRTIINFRRDDSHSNNRPYNPVHNSHEHSMRQAHDRAIHDHLDKDKGRGTRRSSSREYDNSNDDYNSDDDNDDDYDEDKYWEEQARLERKEQQDKVAHEKWCEKNNIPYYTADDGTKIYQHSPSFLNTIGNGSFVCDSNGQHSVDTTSPKPPAQQPQEQSQQKAESKILSSALNTMMESSSKQETSTEKSDEHSLDACAEKFDKESQKIDDTRDKNTPNNGQNAAHEFNREFSKEVGKKIQEKGKAFRKEQELEKGVQAGREVVAKMKEERAKGSQAKPSSVPGSYQSEKRSTAREDHIRTLNKLQKFTQQNSHNYPPKQQNQQPRKDFYKSSDSSTPPPKSTKQKHVLNDFEREMARSGCKSKRELENDAIDAENQKLAQQHAAQTVSWSYTPLTLEEKACYEREAKEREWRREEEKRVKELCTLIKHERDSIKKTYDHEIYSESHKKAINEAWRNAVNNANLTIIIQTCTYYYGPFPNNSPIIQYMQTIKFFDNSNFDDFNTDDIRYQPVLEEFGKEFNRIFQSYSHWERNEYLPQLRMQSDDDDHRRHVEKKHLTDEDNKRYAVFKKQLEERYAKRYKQLRFGVGFWEKTVGRLTSEKTSRQKLQEEEKNNDQMLEEGFYDQIRDNHRLKQTQEKLKQNSEELDETKEILAEIELEIEEAKKKLREEQEDKNDEARHDQHKERKDFRSLEDCGTIIWPEQHNPTINLDEIDLSLVEFIVTTPRDTFLQEMGIIPYEFNTFKGGNTQQEIVHRKLSSAIENAVTLGIEVAPHVRQLQQELFKAAYNLNKGNYTSLATALTSLLKALSNEVINTVSHPIEYSQRRFNNLLGAICQYPKLQLSAMIRSTRIIAQQCREISRLTTSNLSFFEKYEKMNNAVKSMLVESHVLFPISVELDGLSKAQDLIKELNNLTAEERHKFFAQTAVDGFVDYLAIVGAYKTFNFAQYHRSLRNIPYRPKVITVEAFDNPRPSHANPIALVEGAAKNQLPAIIENSANQEIATVAQANKNVASKFTGDITTPLGFGKKTVPLLSDFSKTVQSFNQPATVLKRSKPYAKCVKDLTNKIAAEKAITTHALNLIKDSKKLTTLSHIYRKETVIEALKALEFTSKEIIEKEKNQKILIETIKDLTKLNSRPEWESLKYNTKNEVTKKSIEYALKIIRPQETKIAKDTIEGLRTSQSKESIWCQIEPTEGLLPETLIPRSFTIDVEGTKLWVHPNATKHFEELIVSHNLMGEFLGSSVLPAQQTLYVQEFILTEFYATLKELIKDGIPYTTRAIELNNWEISLAAGNKSSDCPIIFHALRK